MLHTGGEGGGGGGGGDQPNRRLKSFGMKCFLVHLLWVPYMPIV